MKQALSFSFLAIFLTGCGSAPIPKSDKYQMEMTLHKTRADLEEVKHDLHSHRMETNILEGKMLNQEDTMASLKKETYDQHQAKLDHYAHQIIALEKRLTHLEKEKDELFRGQQKLLQTSQDMHKAIAQGKDKISEMEKILAQTSKSMSEIAKLKKNVSKVNHVLETSYREFIVDSYRVKSGETLDVIAKNFHTTPDTLLKINHLENDRILAGQELLVPLTVSKP